MYRNIGHLLLLLTIMELIYKLGIKDFNLFMGLVQSFPIKN